MTTTLNIGLAIGDTGQIIEPGAALAKVRINLGDIPVTYAVVQSDTEQTLVAVMEDEPTVGGLMALCDALQQDCVAVLADGDKGRLVGPRAATWGAFDPAKFIDWPTANLKATRKAYEDADLAHRAMDAERAEARRAAVAAVDAAFAERLAATNAARNAASTAKWHAENAAAAAKPHEWEGRKVKRTTTKGRWSDKVEQIGVVFTRKHTDEMGRMPSWRIPPVGTPMVRLLKKDGSEGLTVEKLAQVGAKWELV